MVGDEKERRKKGRKEGGGDMVGREEEKAEVEHREDEGDVVRDVACSSTSCMISYLGAALF